MFGLNPEQITIIGMLLAIGAAGLKKLWVFGWTYAEKDKDLDEMTVDRDFWRDTALKALGALETEVAAVGRKKAPGA